MSERKINLKEIFEKHRQMFINNNRRHPDYIIDAMKEACRQVLELAVIKMKADAMETFGTDIPDCWDESSIINTINQVE